MSDAEREAGLLDRLADQVERGDVGRQARREAALVAEAGREALLLQHRLERVVGLGAPAQRLAERRRADRGDHEFLDVDVGVGVRAAVHDVEHRHRQQVRVRAAEVAEQAQLGRGRGGLRDGERDAEDRVRAEVRLLRRAVEVEHLLVDGALVARLVPDDLGEDPLLDVVDGLLDALAAVALRVAVAQFVRLERAGRRAGRDGRAGGRAVVQADLHLDRRDCRASPGSRGRRLLRWWPLLVRSLFRKALTHDSSRRCDPASLSSEGLPRVTDSTAEPT